MKPLHKMTRKELVKECTRRINTMNKENLDRRIALEEKTKSKTDSIVPLSKGTMITVFYDSVDGFSKTGFFKTLRGARKFAKNWIDHPVFELDSAVDDDGVGQITCLGCKITDLWDIDLTAAMTPEELEGS